MATLGTTEIHREGDTEEMIENSQTAEGRNTNQRPIDRISGFIAAATNMKNGTVLKYHEPHEVKKCPGWRIYIFKDGKVIDVLELNGQSSFLVGRDRSVADIPVDHTSCSKQHAVIQFRQVSHMNKRGEVNKVTRYWTFWRGLTLDCMFWIWRLRMGLS